MAYLLSHVFLNLFLIFFSNHRDRLTASDMIHVKKVMEHVYEKIVLSDNSSNSSNGGADKMPPDELSALADAKVEIHCNDMVSVVFFLILFPWKIFAIGGSIDSVIVSEELQSVTKINGYTKNRTSTPHISILRLLDMLFFVLLSINTDTGRDEKG